MFAAFKELTVSDQSIWLVCAAFYFVDNLKFHSGRELILSETWSGSWAIIFPVNHYRLRGRAITLLRPWLPFMASVKLTWLNQDAFSVRTLRQTKCSLLVCRRNLAPFRALSALYCLFLFVLAPAATHYAGLSYALAFVLPVHAVGVLSLVTILIFQRRRWVIQWQHIVSLAFECAVCPGYFVNICRKMSLDYVKLQGDGVAYVVDQAQPNMTNSYATEIDILVEELLENGELRHDDDKAIAGYHARLIELGLDAEL